MFKQSIENGQQVENPDNWLHHGNVWEFQRPEAAYMIKFYGKTVAVPDENGKGTKQHWLHADHVDAMPYHMPLPGYDT